MCRSLPMERTTTSPELSPTRICTGVPPARWSSSAYRLTRRCIRSAAEGHDPVAHHLVDGPLVVMHGLHHAFEHGIEELPGLFGVAVGQQLHRSLEIGEEHRDLFALAL